MSALREGSMRANIAGYLVAADAMKNVAERKSASLVCVINFISGAAYAAS